MIFDLRNKLHRRERARGERVGRVGAARIPLGKAEHPAVEDNLAERRPGVEVELFNEPNERLLVQRERLVLGARQTSNRTNCGEAGALRERRPSSPETPTGDQSLISGISRSRTAVGIGLEGELSGGASVARRPSQPRLPS